VVVTILGAVLFRRDTADLPDLLRRSAIGSFGWGVVIAIAVWASRRMLAMWARRSHR
jgi:hypothetical protein